MSVPLIPILAIFLFACIIMVVGLCMSPRGSAPEAERVEVTVRRSSTFQPSDGRGGRGRRSGQRYTSDGMLLSVGSQAGVIGQVRAKPIFGSSLGKTVQRWRLPVIVVLIFSGALYLLLQIPLGNSAVFSWSLANAPAAPTKAAIATPTPLPQTPAGFSSASKNAQHLAQMDRAQYNTDAEYNTWAASACSATAMTVVINAYGHHYRITDILKVEIQQHAIDPDLGLLEPVGVNRTVDKLGFRTLQMNKAPLDSLIAVANNGWPIIIGFPPGLHWPGGHILVMTGGDSNKVFLADSAPSNLPWVSHDRFMQDWGGMALIVIPKDR